MVSGKSLPAAMSGVCNTIETAVSHTLVHINIDNNSTMLYTTLSVLAFSVEQRLQIFLCPRVTGCLGSGEEMRASSRVPAVIFPAEEGLRAESC